MNHDIVISHGELGDEEGLTDENRMPYACSRTVTAQVRPLIAGIGKRTYDKLRLSAYFSSVISY